MISKSNVKFTDSEVRTWLVQKKKTVSPGARDRLWPSRLLGKLANFNLTRIIPWTVVVSARMTVETLEWAVCSYMFEDICNVDVGTGSNPVPLVV